MQIKLEQITPVIAKRMLENNTTNRVIRMQKVCEYANEMASGRWHQTGDPIRFFEDGTLADGQHRLEALIASGVILRLPVVRGLKPESMVGIDMGAKRSVADFMHLHHGMMNANIGVAAIRKIYAAATGKRFTVTPALAEIAHGFYGKAIEEAHLHLSPFGPTRKGWIVGLTAFGLRSTPKIADFARILGTGENAKKGNPALTLRNWIIERKSYHLLNFTANNERGAVDCFLNAMYSFISDESIAKISSGPKGSNYFRQKERQFIAAISEEVKRLDASNN